MTEDPETPDSDAADGGSSAADAEADADLPAAAGDGSPGEGDDRAPDPEPPLPEGSDADGDASPAESDGGNIDADGDADPAFAAPDAEEPGPSGAMAATAGESVVADGASASASGTVGSSTPDDYFADFDADGPEEDVEMPLADHIEEMIGRLGVVFFVGGLVTLAVFPFAADLINYLWNTHIPGASTIADRRPRLYGPLELVLTELKVAALAGLLAGLPVFVYQSYRFMRPGLYPNERRYYLAAVPTSLVLGFVGVSFAHFVVLPAIFAYFTAYTTGTALVAFGLRETFNLILLLMGYMAVVFQIPLFIMLGIMMGLVTRGWLEDKRLLFWGAFAGISFIVSPDPTGMAPIIVTVTMITLYEGTLALLRWTGN